MKTFKDFKSQILEALIQKGQRLGSNPGGLHTDDQTGEDHYVKYPKNPDQAKTEALSSKIHQMLGVNTIPSEQQMINGKQAVVSKWVNGLRPMKLREISTLHPDDHKQIGKLFAAAVLTRNHDAVGTGLDYGEGNLYLDKNNRLHHGDVGGSFHYRAQGGIKTI
jgi:hypothetical protein